MTIADINATCAFRAPDAHAAARLHAAAPAMLAALAAVMEDLRLGWRDAADNGEDAAWLADAQARIEAAETAINKAKGA